MPQCPITGCWREATPGLVLCAVHRDDIDEAIAKQNKETDNNKLIRLTMDLREHGVTYERVRALREHVGKCQNQDTCDGSVDADVWQVAQLSCVHANNLLLTLDRMAYWRH